MGRGEVDSRVSLGQPTRRTATGVNGVVLGVV